MRTKIAWAELHSPIFLAGTNLSQKLDPKKRQGLIMEYDEDKHQLYVTYTNPNPVMGEPATRTARVPEPSILSMVEADVVRAVAVAVNESVDVPAPVKKKISAQVSGPTDHVFGGPGAGKSR